MASTLDRWYTIADKYLLRFSSIDTVVVCRMCCACVCVICVLFFKKLSVMYVKISIGNSMVCNDIWHKYHE